MLVCKDYSYSYSLLGLWTGLSLGLYVARATGRTSAGAIVGTSATIDWVRAEANR